MSARRRGRETKRVDRLPATVQRARRAGSGTAGGHRYVDTGGLVAAAAVCASLLGSRLPDVDQRGARIHRHTRLERRSRIAGLAGRILRVPMTIFALLATHRGATHWLLSGAATTIILGSAAGAVWSPLTLPVAIGVGCGNGAHLLADACTPHGAPLLGPVRTSCVHLLPRRMLVATGGVGDLLVLLLATLTATALGLLVLAGGVGHLLPAHPRGDAASRKRSAAVQIR